MNRDARLWFALAFMAAGSLLTLAVLLPPKLARPRPTEPETHAQDALRQLPVDGTPMGDGQADLPPWMKCETLAGLLRDQAPVLRVVRPDPSAGVCYICDGDAEPPAAPPSEEFADCWRGAVECVADPPPSRGDGPHACRGGDFRLFGDVELTEKVKPVAELVHYGPYRGVGGPATPRYGP
jgi:hypothetical protein